MVLFSFNKKIIQKVAQMTNNSETPTSDFDNWIIALWELSLDLFIYLVSKEPKLSAWLLVFLSENMMINNQKLSLWLILGDPET
jgi:hypothetical protein